MKYKKVIILSLVVVLLSFFCFIPNFYAEEKPTPLKNITLVEHVFIGSYDTSYDKIEYTKAIEGDDQFLLLSLPHRFDTFLSTAETQSRGDLYCQEIQAIPVIAVDGVVDPRDKETSDHWPEVIKNGIANHKDLATFSFRKLPTGQYEVTATGTSDVLAKLPNLYMNVIFYQDWVPCTWENGDTTIRNLARKFPLGPYGQKVKLAKNISAIVKFDAILPEEFLNMYGFVAVIQDMDTYKNVASGYFKFADTQNPAYFQWNSWPKFTYDPIKNTLLDQYVLSTGVSEMKFRVRYAKDLKLVHLEMDYKEAEKGVYDILGCSVADELKAKSKFSYDGENKKVSIVFNEPINGDRELFSFVVHWKKENLDTSSNFKIKNLIADNTKNNSLYFDLNDIRQYYPNMLLVKTNVLDFNEDSWIDDIDLSLLMTHFGTKETDKGFNTKFDLVKSESDTRIDMDDLLFLLSEINQQERLLKKSGILQHDRSLIYLDLHLGGKVWIPKDQEVLFMGKFWIG